MILQVENEFPYVGIGDGHGFLTDKIQEPLCKAIIIITCIFGKIFKPQIITQLKKIFFVH